MLFLYPQPTDEQLREMYRSDYFSIWGIASDDEEAPRAMKHRTFRRLLEVLARRVEPGKVLDVGCATGFFLEVAAAAGWEAYGVELSGFASKFAQRKFGERVFNGTLEQAAYPGAFFDAVTLFDLLEHVPDPRAFLREVRRVLRPDGTLMLVMPNVASLSARLMGPHWSHYNQEHLHYFSPETIDRLLAESGFAVERVANAPKYLNLDYIVNQFRKYPHKCITPLCRVAAALLPAWMKRLNLTLSSGQMLVLARNRGN